MGLYTQLPDNIRTVDVIIVGGGTAGCVVASRLADADRELSVLVIEGGPNGADNPAVKYPAFFFGNILPNSTTATFFKSKPAENLSNREVIIPTASVLGGGSAMNMMMYSRAQRADWDSWRTPGWSANEMLPFLKKLETYHGPGLMENHGSNGPIHVSAGTFCGKRSQDDFVSAVNKVGWPEIDDLASLDACNGVQRAVRFVSPDGERQDTASRYLQPRLQDGAHPNLHVLVESEVVRVIFDDKKASGVVYLPKTQGATSQTVNAKKLVIISAGAFGTPTILERSGIGDPEALRRVGISDLIADVPGVGYEYEDHNLILYSYKSSLDPHETLDSLLTGALDPGELIQKGHKFLGWNAQDATCKLRPADRDVASLGPVFQEAWDKEFRGNDNRPLMIITLVNCFPGEHTGIPPGQYFGISTFTAYPFSKGRIHITGPALTDPPDFDTGFFSDERGLDLMMHRWAYKKQREIVRRMSLFRGELPSSHPPFPPESAAACVSLDGPLTHVQDIEYSAEDDAIIDQFAREHVGSPWHSLGTCKMAPRDEHGVVDRNLSVYGVQGLKIADLSIAPKNVAANTQNTALAIGERAADIFIRELGLGKV
ncbi:alcohol oxidase [Xylaria palmicola]|nr:alcohol oxidase [Xylaria palmicola]